MFASLKFQEYSRVFLWIEYDEIKNYIAHLEME